MTHFNSSWFDGQYFPNFILMILNKFCIGFTMLGFFVGQSRTLIFFSWNHSFLDFAVWGHARLYKEINSLFPNLFTIYGIRKWSQTFWQTVALSELFKKQILLTPVTDRQIDRQPQTIINWDTFFMWLCPNMKNTVFWFITEMNCFYWPTLKISSSYLFLLKS